MNNRVAATSTCNLIIDGTTEQTNTSVNDETLTSFTETLSGGSHQWNITCWENGVGAIDYSETRTLDVDTTPPAWSSNQSSIPAVYSSITLSRFNITWTDNAAVSKVWFESNFSGNPQNYTMINTSANVWNYSVILPAGSFYWKSYANDTANNWNSSDTWYFTIARAAPFTNLTVNASASATTIDEENSVWINGSAVAGDSSYTLEMYINNVLKATNTSGPVRNYTLFDTPGIFNVTMRYIQTQNYTERNLSLLVTVKDITLPSPSNNQQHIPTVYNSAFLSHFNITWTDSYGNVTHALFESNISGTQRNYTMVNSSANVWNFSAILPAGSFYWKSYANDTSNNWNRSDTWLFTISKAASDINLTVNGSASSQTIDEDNSVWINGSVVAGDSSYTLEMYIDNVLKATNTSGPVRNYTLFDTPGIFNVTLRYIQTQNYSERNLSLLVTVKDITPPSPSSNQQHIPTLYDPTFLSHFNITWQDISGISNVTLESNFSGSPTNYSMANSSAIVWNYSLILPAGSFYWRSYANDTSNNWNRSDIWYFTISRAASDINLTVNASASSQTIDEDNSVWINGSVVTGDSSYTLEMYIDNALKATNTSGPIANYTLFDTPGIFNVTLRYIQTQNYSERNLSLLVTVKDITPPSPSSNQSHIPSTYNASFLSHFNITWTDSYGNISHVYLESNFSGVPQNYSMVNSTATEWNYSVILPAGSFYWKSYANDTANNWNSTDKWYFAISKANSVINLTINGTSGNLTVNEGTSIWLNGTLITGDPVAISLYINGALHNTGNSPISNFTNFTTPGLYNITLTYTSSQNYSSGSLTYWVNVNDTSVPIVQSHSPTGTVTSSSATLSVTTNEDAVCRFSLISGVAYANMTYEMSGTGTSHTYSLSGLTNGVKHYYARCNNTYGLVSATDYDASFTVSIETPAAGGGGGRQPPESQTEKSVEFNNPAPNLPHSMAISLEELDVTRLTFVNREPVNQVTVSVKKIDESRISEKLENVYQYVNITFDGLPANEIESGALDFKVNKSWLQKGGFSKYDVKLRRYNYGLWQLINVNWIKETELNHYYNATLSGFSVFAITAEKPVTEITEQPEEKPVEKPESITEPPPGKWGPPVEAHENITEPVEETPIIPVRPVKLILGCLLVLVAVIILLMHKRRA